MKKKSVWKKLSLLTACALTLGVLSGCSQNTTAENNSQPESSSPETPADDNQTAPEDIQPANQDPVVITAWHDNDEIMMNALAEVVNQALTEDNITLRFEKKSDVTGQIRLYGTDAANGPE